MGKGDVKTKKGKVAKGSYGVRRPRPKTTNKDVTKVKGVKDEKPKAAKAKKTEKKK